MARIDDLIKQIQSQGTASKWSGGFGAEDATKDMARILDSIGISDIKQFGKVTQYEPVEVIKTLYNGQEVRTQTDENGKTSSYVYEPTGKMLTGTYGDGGDYTYPETRMVAVPKDAKLENVYGVARDGGDYGTYYEPVDPSKTKTVNGKLVADTGITTFGNKETGQAVPNTYSERQTGDAWGGTFQGKGNTGYRVQFRDDGTPVFYTTGASSNDLANLLADNPLLNIAANVAATAFGGPLGAGALQLAQGKDIGDAAKATLLAYAGKELTSGLGGGGDSSLAPTDTGGLIGGSESVFDPTFGGELSPVIGGGAESVFDPTFGGTLSDVGSGGMTAAELAQLDLALGGSGGSAGATELGNALATGAPTATNTALTGGSGVFTGAAGGITPDSVAAKLAGDTAGATASKFPLSVSDTIRLAGIGATLAGGAKLAGDAMGGSGGYPIVPVPTDWTSPIKPTGVAEFTPLAPIDFGNKEMLQGTQWEQLLSPDYGKAPAMPSMPTNPSNMSFDQLMGVLGNTRTSMPTQNVSINDVIAGIQSQYGQTPTGSMG